MSEFCMPSLGADMEAATLVKWYKAPGDQIARGDIIAVVETQKGAIEIEVFDDGELTSLLVEPGTTVPVGTPIAIINGDKEAPVTEPSQQPPKKVVTPRSKRENHAPKTTQAKISPAARRIAAEQGTDISKVKGTGPGGAVVSADVLSGAPEKPTRLDLVEMRKAIAAAVARSKREIPHYYLSHTVDLTRAHEWLARTNAGRPPVERLLMGVLFLKASAIAVGKRTGFNGYYNNESFQPSKSVHAGLAIAIRGGGLVSPALRDADTLSLPELMVKMRDLVKRARQGHLRSSEVADATVTISSLGDRGVEQLFGVIYPPQVALIGFGAVSTKPMVVDGTVMPRPTTVASLSADHRVSDGHAGALLLGDIDSLLQEPEAL